MWLVQLSDSAKHISLLSRTRGRIRAFHQSYNHTPGIHAALYDTK